MIKMIFAAALVLAIAGCASPVVMRNPATGEMAQCEVPPMSFWGAYGQSRGIEQCAAAYERAGWERMN
jgi:hypothetical protein